MASVLSTPTDEDPMAEEPAESAKPQNSRRQLILRVFGFLITFAAGIAGGVAFKSFGSTSEGDAASTDTTGEAAPEAAGEAKAEGHGETKAEGPSEAKAETKAEGEAPAEAHGAPEKTSNGALATLNNGRIITNLKTVVVNLRSSGGGRVLRMEVQVESAQDVALAVELAIPKLRDTLITATSDYTFAELEGTDGKTRLRDELLTRINGIMAPLTIDQVYFTQFVVQ
jgi:flagellar basal body-associated protein FliL